MRLLISVSDAVEVPAALAGGADIVDVKDPSQGSLGAPTPGVLRAVRAQVAPPVELSVALGDVPHLPGTLALAAYGAVACGADYVKVGPLDSRPEAALQLLIAVKEAAWAANPRARVVVVAYADAEPDSSLSPYRLPEIASEAGIDGVLLDTAVKNGRSSLALLGEVGVSAFLQDARARGLFTGLAGALTAPDLSRLRGWDVDLVGVRGAACDGGRSGRVSETRVREVRAALGLSAPAFPRTAPAPAASSADPGAAR